MFAEARVATAEYFHTLKRRSSSLDTLRPTEYETPQATLLQVT
jgi:hypothetical protein